MSKHKISFWGLAIGVLIISYAINSLLNGGVLAIHRVERNEVLALSEDAFGFWYYSLIYLAAGIVVCTHSFSYYYPEQLKKLLKFTPESALTFQQVLFIVIGSASFFCIPMYVASRLASNA